MRHIFWALIVIMIASGCALGTDVDEASEIALTVIPLEVTEESFARNITIEEVTEEVDPSPTVTATHTAQPVQNARTNSNCSVRTDLPVYSVIAGDTLSSVATQHGTTATQLSEFNCLNDSNLIRVGQQLHVPRIFVATPTPYVVNGSVVTPTITNLGVQGVLRITPSTANTHPIKGTIYIFPVDATLTVDWTGIEPATVNQIVEVTFTFTFTNGTVSQIGTDSNVADGISLTWYPPDRASGAIYATARTRDNGFIEAPVLRVEEQFTPLESSTSNTDMGIRGTLSAYPLIEAGNSSDWGDYVLEPQTTVTVDWTGIEPENMVGLIRAEFFYIPDNGVRQLMATDNNLVDGIAISWTPPAGVSGEISAVVYDANNNYYRSSTFHVREPEE